jgi:hypothetical protein
MAMENRLWGQKRIQAELARLGFKVSARTVAKYMRTARRDRGPSVRWRTFLKLHASNIWACDFFCVQTLLFETLHVFFVIQHINREVLHVAVTRIRPPNGWRNNFSKAVLGIGPHFCAPQGATAAQMRRQILHQQRYRQVRAPVRKTLRRIIPPPNTLKS